MHEECRDFERRCVGLFRSLRIDSCGDSNRSKTFLTSGAAERNSVSSAKRPQGVSAERVRGAKQNILNVRFPSCNLVEFKRYFYNPGAGISGAAP